MQSAVWKTWANLLTLIRLGSTLPCAWAILSELWAAAALLFTLAVITDFLDGPIARRYGHESPLGGLFDHATDALFVTTCLAALAYSGYVPYLLPLLVIAAFVQYMLDSSALAGQRLRTSWLGKSNGIFYYVLVGIALIRNGAGLDWPPDTWVRVIGWILVGTTLGSMVDRVHALVRTRKSNPGG